MDSSSDWTGQDEDLLRNVRRIHRASAQLPTIPGYEDLSELARGGQGVVFVGTQVSTHRRVAIKILLEGALASREARRRFEREIELVTTLRHPNIVSVYDCGTTADGRMYYIMEYIEGFALDKLIDAARAVRPDSTVKSPSSPAPHTAASASTPSDFQSERARLTLFAKICDGVQHAHQQGVIHRDLKPSNIRIDRAGEPHVLDFGLAKLSDASPDATKMSQTGGFMGSIPWASPEQAEGTTQLIDVRSDVYSLGVVFYQLLTGAFPYPLDGSLREALEAIRSAPARPPRELRREISDELSTIVLKCLSKEPDRRYQSAGELARDIRRYLADEPIEAKRDSAWYSVRKKLDRYKVVVRAVSILFVASLMFSLGMVWLWSRAVDAEHIAEQRFSEAEAAHRAEVEVRQALQSQVTKTEHVRNFLDTTLRTVDPWKHPGRDLGPLQEMLDGAVKRLEGAFPDQPEVEAAIAGTLGWDYRQLGLNAPAETLMRRSYGLLRQVKGDEDEAAMNALNDLAILMTDTGRHAEAAAMFERLRSIQEKTLGPEHQSTLVTTNNLALDLDWQGRSVEAETLYRKTLEAQTRLFGTDDIDRLSTLNNLASCITAVGKVEEAERLFNEVIDIKTKIYGPDHPETLTARMNVLDLLADSGRLAEAESRVREILATCEEKLSAAHPLTLVALQHLSLVLSQQSKYDESVVVSRKAYEAQLAFSGPNHPTTLIRKNALAASLIQLERWDEGIPLTTELHEQLQRMFGPNDWRTITAAGNLAFALNKIGRAAEAEKIWTRLSDIPSCDNEASESAVATARANLAFLMANQKRWAEAEKVFRAALAGEQKPGEAESWRSAHMRAGLASVLIETGRLDEAEKELTRAIPILREAFGDTHEKTQKALGYSKRLQELRSSTAQEKALGN